MKTRLLLLLAAVILLTTAPAVLAQPFDCNRCVPLPTLHCAQAFHVFGFTECVVDETGCHLTGEECGPWVSAPALASEYVVASVERVDEPTAAASAPLVAPDDTQPLTH